MSSHNNNLGLEIIRNILGLLLLSQVELHGLNESSDLTSGFLGVLIDFQEAF